MSKNPTPAYWMYLQCLCGCGSQIGQRNGLRKKYYVDELHYNAHRTPLRRAQAKREAEAGGEDALLARRLAEEMAPIVAKQEAASTAAERVRIVVGPASYALWSACLEISL